MALWATWGAAIVVVAAGTTYLLRTSAPAIEEIPRWVEVERVRSGDTVIVDPDEKLIYLGVRAPVQDEPLFEESRARNEALVKGKKVRVRYEPDMEHDQKGRLLAYVFVEKTLINAELIREGLAYARIADNVQRFSRELLAAQVKARQARRGVWALAEPARDSEYWADPKYGLFHRPSCPEKAKAKPERIVTLASRRAAFDHGWAPCTECRP